MLGSPPLIATKLRPPLQAGQSLRRERLQRRLAAVLDDGCRLALVVSPAGYGKSTLVAAWVAALASATACCGNVAAVRASWLALVIERNGCLLHVWLAGPAAR